jgi:hypothetical protein
MSIEVIEAYSRAAQQHRRLSDTVEVHLVSLNALGRRITIRQFDADGALDVEMVGRMVVTRRRRLFGRALNRICHALGWHSRRQKVATNAFISALESHTRDIDRVARVLQEEGVRRDRALTARQLLKVVYRFEPEIVQRMEYSSMGWTAPSGFRAWHYAQQVVLKLKSVLRI